MSSGGFGGGGAGGASSAARELASCSERRAVSNALASLDARNTPAAAASGRSRTPHSPPARALRPRRPCGTSINIK